MQLFFLRDPKVSGSTRTSKVPKTWTLYFGITTISFTIFVWWGSLLRGPSLYNARWALSKNPESGLRIQPRYRGPYLKSHPKLCLVWKPYITTIYICTYTIKNQVPYHQKKQKASGANIRGPRSLVICDRFGGKATDPEYLGSQQGLLLQGP